MRVRRSLRRIFRKKRGGKVVGSTFYSRPISISSDTQRTQELLELLDLLTKFRDELKQQEERDVIIPTERFTDNDVIELPSLFEDDSQVLGTRNDVPDGKDEGMFTPLKSTSYGVSATVSPLFLDLLAAAAAKNNDVYDPFLVDFDPYASQSSHTRETDAKRSYRDDREENKLLLMNDLPRIAIEAEGDSVDPSLMLEPDSSFRENRVIPSTKYLEEESIFYPSLASDSTNEDKDTLRTMVSTLSKSKAKPHKTTTVPASFLWGRLDGASSSSFPSQQTASLLDNFLFRDKPVGNREVGNREEEVDRILSLGRILDGVD